MIHNSNTPATAESSSDELEWSAFRYVADEMSAEEAAAFESLLAENERAREVVARTVQITHALVSLPAGEVSAGDSRATTPASAGAGRTESTRTASVSETSGTKRTGTQIGAAAILLAAAVCIVVAFGLRMSNGPLGPERTRNSRPNDRKLAGTAAGLLPGSAGGDLVISAWIDFQPEDVLPEEKLIADETNAVHTAGDPSASEDEGRFAWIVAAIDPEDGEQGGLDDLRKGEQ